MKSFSVLTVSKRTGWEETAVGSIARQTVLPNKWVIVHEEPEKRTRAIMEDMDFEEFPTCVIDAPPKTRLSNLNASLNAGLRLIDTDYVIFYQDFISLQEDCFEKLLELATPRTFVSTCTPNYDGSDDGRYTGCDLPRPCRPEEWEANVSIAPMKMIRELGGFPNHYDAGWSWDNVNVAQRAAMLGAKFICDESNRPKLYPHEMESHNTLPKNGEMHNREIAAIRRGDRPLRYNYLQ